MRKLLLGLCLVMALLFGVAAAENTEYEFGPGEYNYKDVVIMGNNPDLFGGQVIRLHKVTGEYVYIVLKDGTAEILKYHGSSESVEVPAEIDGYIVTSIGREAFARQTSLVSVAIPESVTYIARNAFLQCTSLASITIPDGVTSIGEWAFAGCTALTNITLPDSVTSIGEKAFAGCSSLTLTVTAGSCAERHARDNDILYIYPGQWICLLCRKINTTNFCPECGTARPNPDPECVNCGYNPEGETPNFCPDCGTKF